MKIKALIYERKTLEKNSCQTKKQKFLEHELCNIFEQNSHWKLAICVKQHQRY